MDVWSVRRGNQVGVDGEEETSACESDGGSKDKAGACAVEEVPDSWICEGEGKTELEG